MLVFEKFSDGGKRVHRLSRESDELCNEGQGCDWGEWLPTVSGSRDIMRTCRTCFACEYKGVVR